MFNFGSKSSRTLPLSITIPDCLVSYDVITIEPDAAVDYHQRPLDRRYTMMKLITLNELKNRFDSRGSSVYTTQDTAVQKVQRWRSSIYTCVDDEPRPRSYLDGPDVPLSPLSDIPTQLIWDGENYVLHHTISPTSPAPDFGPKLGGDEDGLCTSAVTRIDYPLLDLYDVMPIPMNASSPCDSPSTSSTSTSSPDPFFNYLGLLDANAYADKAAALTLPRPSSHILFPSSGDDTSALMLGSGYYIPDIEDEDEEEEGDDLSSEYGYISSECTDTVDSEHTAYSYFYPSPCRTPPDDFRRPLSRITVALPRTESAATIGLYPTYPTSVSNETSIYDLSVGDVGYAAGYFSDQDVLGSGVDLCEASSLKNKLGLTFASAPEVEDVGFFDYDELQMLKLARLRIR